MRRLRRYALGTLAVIGGLFLVLIAYGMIFLSSSDKSKIEGTIEAVATSGDPGYCGSAMTRGYLRQTTGAPARYAVDACRQEAPSAAAHSVAIDSVERDGDRATATVANQGGSFDGSWLVVRLVKTDGAWKLDRLVRFARFDRAGFDRAYRKHLKESETQPTAAGCILARASELSDAQLERLALHGLQAAFGTIAVECDRRGTEEGVVEALADPELSFSPRAIACAERQVEAFSDAELVALRTDLGTYGKLLFGCDAGAVISYTERNLKDHGKISKEAIPCVLDTLHRLPGARAGSLIYEEARFGALLDRCDNSA